MFLVYWSILLSGAKNPRKLRKLSHLVLRHSVDGAEYTGGNLRRLAEISIKCCNLLRIARRDGGGVTHVTIYGLQNDVSFRLVTRAQMNTFCRRTAGKEGS